MAIDPIQMRFPAVLIVSYGRPDLLERCLASLRTHAPNSAVLIFDNRSDESDEVRELSLRYPRYFWLFAEENHGFSYGVNRLAENCNSDFLLLNPDAELTGPLDGLSRSLYSAAETACVAPLNAALGDYPWDVAHKNTTLVRSLVSHAGYSSALRKCWASELYRSMPSGPVGYLGGAMLLVRREAWEQIGGLDERYFLYCEEVDWQLRAQRKGWKSVLYPEKLFIHNAHGTVSHERAAMSRSAQLLRSSQIEFFRQNCGEFSARFFAAGLRVLDATQRSKRLSR